MPYFALIFSFLLTFMVMPAIIRLAEMKRIFDPSDERKRHNRHVSALGGVGIFMGVVLSSLIFLGDDVWSVFRYLFAAYLLVFLLGVLDDLRQTNSWLKFLVQIAAAITLVIAGGIRITSFQGLFTVFELAHYSSIFFSIVFVLMIINAFNFIDGIDSLSSILGIIFLLFSAFWFYWIDDQAWLTLTLCLLGGLSGFLAFNLPPARIFMGDSGSQSTGLLIAAIAITGIEGQIDVNSSPSLLSGPAVAFSLLSVLLFDMLRVIIARIAKGRHPFSPDQTHIHHRLLAKGYSVRRVLLTLSLFTVILYTLNLLLDYKGVGVNYLMSADFILTGAFFFVLLAKGRVRPNTEHRTSNTEH